MSKMHTGHRLSEEHPFLEELGDTSESKQLQYIVENQTRRGQVLGKNFTEYKVVFSLIISNLILLVCLYYQQTHSYDPTLALYCKCS